MNPLRIAAQKKLSDIKGAFLRCDRGEGLYITNSAVRSGQSIDWAAAGFEVRMKGKMTFLMPKDEWLQPFEVWLRPQVKCAYLSDSAANADFGEIEEADRKLWIDGIKQLEMPSGVDYEKTVRQRAAVCLRTRRGGGTIRICALIADLLREMSVSKEGVQNED